MAYDTLKDEGKEKAFEEVITSSSSIALIFTVITTLLGGALYATHYQLPHIAWWVTYAVGLVISTKITEPKVDTLKFSLSGYLKHLNTGFRQLTSNNLRKYLVFIFGAYGAYVIYDFGLVKPALAASFGYLANAQAILFSVLGILGAIVVKQIPRIRIWLGDLRGMYIVTVTIGVAYTLMFLNLGYWGLITIAIIDIVGRIVYPWLSILLNKEVESKYRATTISTGVLLSRIPYVFMAIFAGQSAENGTLNIFSLVVGGTLLTLTFLNYLYFKILQKDR